MEALYSCLEVGLRQTVNRRIGSLLRAYGRPSPVVLLGLLGVVAAAGFACKRSPQRGSVPAKIDAAPTSVPSARKTAAGSATGARARGYGTNKPPLRRRGPHPLIRTGRPQVRGSLPTGVVRRIVRRYIGEVKSCYEGGLARKPRLEGRLFVEFTIAATGQVVRSKITRSTLRDREVEACVARASRRWRFPKPQGAGVVTVSYPFLLRMAGSSGSGRSKDP